MRDKKKLRSTAWFGGQDRMDSSTAADEEPGVSYHMFDGRPVIGICNTFSEPCNAHFRELAEHFKRGVYEAGGFRVEFPRHVAGDTLPRRAVMLFRSLGSVDVEESIRGNP